MKALNLLVEYAEGDHVYLVTDPDNFKRIVTGYTVRGSLVIYHVSCSDYPEITCYGYELSPNPNFE